MPRHQLLLFASFLAAACGSDGVGPDRNSGAPDTLTVLGLGAVDSRYTAEVAVRGDWAYTTTWGNRSGAPGNAMFVWNVAGPAPVLADSVIVTAASTLGDVQISDDGALLVLARELTPGAIVLFDRSDPAHPALLGTFSNENTFPGVHTVKLGRVNGRLYAFLAVNPGSTGARIVIVDITDPMSPVEVFSQVMGQPFVHDTFVRDGILFIALWHAGVGIWDIGGGGRGGAPANPVHITTFVPNSGSIHNIWWFHDANGARRYLFLGEEGPGSVGESQASGDIHVVDVSDLAQPQQVARYTVPGAGTHNFSMDEQRGVLYAAYYNAGVRALDVRGNLGSCPAAQQTTLGECSLAAMGREVGVALTQGHFIWGAAYSNGSVFATDMRAGLYRIEAAPLAP